MMRWSEWQKRVLLVVVTTLVTLLVAEGVTRLLWEPGERQQVMRYDPVLGWSLRPGSSMHSVDTDRGLDYTITVNALGLRDVERTPQPAAGRQRVLLLGDSMVFGPGVEVAQRASNQLEARLGEDVEVVNAGIGGWGTDQEFLYLCERGFALEPDVVVLAICVVNDVVNNSLTHEFLGTAPKPRFVRGDDGTLQLQEMPPRQGPSTSRQITDVLKHSRLLHYVGRHARILRARLQPPPPRKKGDIPYYLESLESDMSHWNVFHLPYSPAYENAFRVTEDLLAAVADSCAARNVPLLVFAWPQKVELDAEARHRELAHHGFADYNFDLDAPYDRLRRHCEARNIPFVYPLPTFREHHAEENLYFARDPHPNAAGQALAAACLEPHLRALLSRDGESHTQR